MKEISEFKTSLSYSEPMMWVPDTIKHPAKAHLGMIEAIILKYTKEGDLILDPMAGIGSTLILAMVHNRNAIGIEFEGKFCKTARDNIILNRQPKLTPTGHAEIIQGDSRYLDRMLKYSSDSIVMSPPYPSIMDANRHRGEVAERIYSDIQWKTAYSDSPRNIGNLKMGNIDSIVFSPPFGPAQKGGGIAKRGYEGKYGTDEDLHLRHDRPLSKSKANISNLSFKPLDSIITSPPYPGVTHDPRLTEETVAKTEESQNRGYSPKSFTGAHEYSDNKNNIGNLKKQTYFEAMYQVYRGCYKVLKSEGIMILITKNFIRDQKIVYLDKQTIELCQRIGFKLQTRHYRKITKFSFWRIIYKEKYNLTISNEDILVFQKVI